MGLVFVLLLGEIDLSAGTTGGICAAFAAAAVFSGDLARRARASSTGRCSSSCWPRSASAVWLKAWSGPVVVAIGVVLVAHRPGRQQRRPWPSSRAVALGAAVGVFTGFLVAKVGIPSFIVTLALFLAWQGVLLFVLNSQPIGTTNYNLWYNLANGNLSPLWSWVFMIVVVGGYLALHRVEVDLGPARRARPRRAAAWCCCAAG